MRDWERERMNMAADCNCNCGGFELGKMLLLRQTIDGETAFGIFSLLQRILCRFFVSQCKNYACSGYKTHKMGTTLTSVN